MTDTFIHPQALCESSTVGARTHIGAFTHVLPQARIGADCRIASHVLIENQAHVGDRVTVKSGVQLWDGVTLEDDVFVGPNATFTNAQLPCNPQSNPLPTRVQQGASIGANATLLANITIGQNAVVGAGAVATQSVPPNAIVVGNPAKIVGYVNAAASQTAGGASQVPVPAVPDKPGTYDTSVNGVKLTRLRYVPDLRGALSAGEFERDIPFVPLRYFLVFDVPTAKTRGEHAHKQCHQFLIAVKGSVSVVADDGVHREEFLLNRPDLGVHLPPLTWGIQYRYSADAVLLVFASHYYDNADYIRDYPDFLAQVARVQGG